MAWWLPWQRITLSAPVPPEELQRRLAAATADWRSWLGRPVPSPPWRGSGFMAIRGGLFSMKSVVRGTVRADGPGSRLDAVIRPHLGHIGAFAIYVIIGLLLAPQLAAIEQVVLLLVTAAVYAMFVSFARAWLGPIRKLLEEACHRPDRNERASPNVGVRR